ANLLSFAFFSSMGLAIVLACTLAGRYSTRRKYYEPLASEVKAYSAEMGSTVQRPPWIGPFLTARKFQTSLIVLAMLDPLSLQLLLRCGALHDYGRAVLPTIVTLLLTRSVYYTIAYHRHADAGLRDLQLVADVQTRTAREMSSMIGQQLPILACCLSCNHLLHAVCGTGSLVKICLLIYGLSIIVYLWMCLQIRFLFVMEEPKTHFAAWQREQAMSTPDTLLYESNIICSLLGSATAAHRLQAWIRPSTAVYQSLIRRFRRKRVFVRAFLLNVFVCTGALKRLRSGCSRNHLSLRYAEQGDDFARLLEGSLPVVDFLSGLLARRRQGVATAHAATRSRMMRSFVELCSLARRWAHMTRWRRQNGLILFRGCRLIDLQIYVYNLLSPGALCCSALGQSASGSIGAEGAIRQLSDPGPAFMIFLNATLLGLTFRRLSRSVLYWILALSLLLYSYQILWADMLTGDTLRYKLMTPIYKSHAAWLRPELLQENPAPPVINVGQRIVDHEVLHLADSDAFYRPSGLRCSRSAGPISKSIGNFAAARQLPLLLLAARNPRLWRRLSKKMQQQQQQQQQLAASASTGGTGHNVPSPEQLCGE
uniref:Piezo_RRas_bdg domain-containing protein n=1 Tax=Macrostomum lignano TaxID=282301 RepID=A0A1I8JN66_9PLAT